MKIYIERKYGSKLEISGTPIRWWYGSREIYLGLDQIKSAISLAIHNPKEFIKIYQKNDRYFSGDVRELIFKDFSDVEFQQILNEIKLDTIFADKSYAINELNFINVGLESLPMEIFIFESIRNINVSNNKFRDIEESLLELEHLTSINYSYNLLENIPAFVFDQLELDSVDLSSNPILTFEKLRDKSRIKELNISSCELRFIPEEMLDLHSLQKLILNNNNIVEIPIQINKLEKLKTLYITDNKIENLSFEFANMKKLQWAYLKGNPIKNIRLDVVNQPNYKLIQYAIQTSASDNSNNIEWEIPNSIKTSICQYLLYFNEYVKKSKGLDVNITSTITERGINISFSEEENFDEIKLYLMEYVSFIKENVDSLTPEFTSAIEENEKGIAIIELRSQVRHLQTQVEIKNFENKVLREQTDTFRTLLLDKNTNNTFNFTLANQASSTSTATNSIDIQIGKDITLLQSQLDNFIKELKKTKENEIEDDIEDLKELDEAIIEYTEDTKAEDVEKTKFKKLRRILDKINDENSTFGKTVKATKKLAGIAKALMGTYNKIAKEIGLPGVIDAL